jgi:crotonobetainyl-CoA:carnitine CoA-transferase CaiB-like acyl-CoA transferase
MPRALFDELRRTLALGDPAPGEIEIEGSDPVYPCGFPLGGLAAAALAACGLGVSELWELRTGRRQRVRVPLRAAAASLLSFAFLRVGGASPLDVRVVSPTIGLYRGRDGRWIHLHGGFPHLRDGTLRVLGCGDEADAVAAAVAQRDAAALEDELAAERLCGARVRTAAEWAAHPQGRALAAQPLVEVERIGDGDAEALRPGPRPLSGVRVLDLTRVLAGPTCGRSLAEHGADVLRIHCPRLPEIEPFAIDTGHGKRSAALDLDDPRDAARLRALAAQADVFVNGYRSGALERRGFGPEELAALRPGLVYVSIDCYGHSGPWRERPGWEQLAQSVTGLAAEHGGEESPRLLPAAACDYATGYLAAAGALAALARRTREGGSFQVRASLCRTGMWIQRQGGEAPPGESTSIEEALAGGRVPGLAAAEVASLCTASESAWGRLFHLAPVLELSETPPHWERASAPLGSHAAEWAA